MSSVVNPSLSTVKQPDIEMGEIAATLLIKEIESKNPIISHETVVLPTSLIIRESS